MRATFPVVVAALTLWPMTAPGQAAQNPMATQFRSLEQFLSRNLTEAAEEMPADKYGFKPTPAQQGFGEVVAHLAGGNDMLCGAVTGQKPPERAKLTPADDKEKLVAGLKDSFEFCASALAQLDDTHYADSVPFFGGRKVTRARALLIAVDDWADHYSQMAIYLRLNGLLPPTAKRRGE